MVAPEVEVAEASEPMSMPKEKLKLVIRLLPPDLKEQEFFALVKPWVNDDSTISKYFVSGHVSKKMSKKPIYSRAYVIMKAQTYVEQFYAAFTQEVVLHFDSKFKDLINTAS